MKEGRPSLVDRLLDTSVVFSFDRTGFKRHAREFGALPRLEGKTVLITGANSGLGFAATEALARLGATVVMACRDQGRAESARAALLEAAPKADLRLAVLDVSQVGDVRRFCDAWQGPLDVLVNNAGVLPLSLQRTGEGHELTFATNVLGPFALTRGLLPTLRASQGRVLTVSSGGMYLARHDPQALEGKVAEFDGVAAYAQTKRAEVMLNARLAAHEPGVWFAALHPGWADTPAVRASLPRFHAVTRAILRTPAEGADTIVYLAATPVRAETSGRFWFDRAPAPEHVVPWTREREGDTQRLWERLEALTAHG